MSFMTIVIGGFQKKEGLIADTTFFILFFIPHTHMYIFHPVITAYPSTPTCMYNTYEHIGFSKRYIHFIYFESGYEFIKWKKDRTDGTFESFYKHIAQACNPMGIICVVRVCSNQAFRFSDVFPLFFFLIFFKLKIEWIW